MKAVGSYGKSTGTKGRVTEEDHHSRSKDGRAEARGLAGTSSRHGQGAASMETMDMEDQAHMQGGPSTATRRTKLKEHADGYHSGAREIRVKGAVTGSRRVTGSYGRSIGIGELVDTSREHGRRAVSMETMDSYRFTCKGGAGPYARRARHEEDQAQGAGAAMQRTKLKEQAQPQRGPSSRSMQMVTTQGLER
ncbi:uncharacterized protein UDID_18946 [Ustilago sp. UG-2017a]|nr:uncharacterized protein UDID_18946 [Ustilago sp. UG-2017a]